MQIFVTNPNPKKSAAFLWNHPQRARKMITESMQILAAAQEHFNHKNKIKKVNGEEYKISKALMNHPIVKWVNQNEKHVLWLTVHCCVLYLEYASRGGRAFKNIPDNTNILLDQVGFLFDVIEGKGIEFLNFAKCKIKDLDFTNEECVFEAYKKYLEAQEQN